LFTNQGESTGVAGQAAPANDAGSLPARGSRAEEPDE